MATGDSGEPDQPIRQVTVSGAVGVQVGEGNVQYVYNYGQGTWTNRFSRHAPVGAPYRGLDSFEERDRDIFFGRETAISDVMERLAACASPRSPGFLVVSGVSGAGKSSLLHAGLLARLRSEGLPYRDDLPGARDAATWPCLLLTPGTRPLDELTAQLLAAAGGARTELAAGPQSFASLARQAALVASGASGGKEPVRLLLIIDQFEQLFTQCPDEKERRAFIAALHSLTTGTNPPGLVVLGLRADFEPRCAEYPELADPVQRRFLLTGMPDNDLELAITEPARLAGVRVEAELVSRLLREIRARQPAVAVAGTGSVTRTSAGVLPLLSYALAEAWRFHSTDVLTEADYLRTGGIEAAVATAAQRAYKRLTIPQREVARQVFLQLIATGPDGTDTAVPANLTELDAGKDPADVRTVIEAFSAERLLTLTADGVEISHEALLTSWPLLRDTWLEKTRTDRVLRTRLREAASEWERNRCDRSYLWSGSLLESARHLASGPVKAPEKSQPFTPVERGFLDAGQRAGHRATRRRQSLIAVLSALVLIAGGLALWANQQRTEATHESNAARAGLLSANSEITGDSDPALAKLMSIAAWHLSPSEQAWYAMMNAAALPGVTNLPGDTAQFSPDGKVLATGSENNTLQLWDVATMQPMGAPITSAQQFLFDPNGKTIAIESPNGDVRLWNIASRRWTGTPFTHSSGLVAFSPNGSLLVAYADYGQSLQLWNTRSGTVTTLPNTGDVTDIVFSPNGKLVAVESDVVESDAVSASIVTFWSTATWTPLAGAPISPCPSPATPPPLSLAFSPDSDVLAIGCGSTGNTLAMGDGAVAFFNVATRLQIGATITSVDAPVGDISFSPDGKTLAVASLASNPEGEPGGDTFLFSVTTHQLIGQPLSAGGPVFGVTFSPDGRLLASVKESGQIQLWDVATATGQPETAPITVTGGVGETAFSPNGKTLAVGTSAAESVGTVRLYDTAGGKRFLRSLATTSGPISSLAFSPDGKTLAVAASTAENSCAMVHLFDVATGLPMSTFKMCGPSTSTVLVIFSPDGKTMALSKALSNGTTTEVLNVIDHKEIGPPLHSGPNTSAMTFSPNGRILAIGGGDAATGGTIDLWNVATHKSLGSIVNPRATFDSLAFDPDGKTFVTADSSGVVQSWDLATKQATDMFPNDADQFESVAFTPDGKTLAAAGAVNPNSGSGVLILFDMNTSQQIGSTIPLPSSQTVTFSPAGNELVTTASDNPGSMQLWNTSYLTDPELSLCQVDGALFTPAEWSATGTAAPYENACGQR